MRAQWPTWGRNSADGIPASFVPRPPNPCPSHWGTPNSPIAERLDLVLLHVLSEWDVLEGKKLPFPKAKFR